MGFLKFVIAFVGGALTAVAAGVAIKKKKEEVKPDKNIEIEAEFEENVVVENGKFTVKKAGSEITLKFNGKTSCETYLYFHNLEFESVDPVSIYSDDEWEELSEYEQKQRETSKKYWTHHGRTILLYCKDRVLYGFRSDQRYVL